MDNDTKIRTKLGTRSSLHIEDAMWLDSLAVMLRTNGFHTQAEGLDFLVINAELSSPAADSLSEVRTSREPLPGRRAPVEPFGCPDCGVGSLEESEPPCN